MENRSRVLMWLALFALFVPGWLISARAQQATSAGAGAKASASAPEQPIPFSHKTHAGTLAMPCEFCHAPSQSGESLLKRKFPDRKLVTPNAAPRRKSR